MLKLKLMMKLKILNYLDNHRNHLQNFKNDFIVLVIIFKYFQCNYQGRLYYLIKYIRSSTFIES